MRHGLIMWCFWILMILGSKNWCKNACRNALENGLDVIVCNTFTKQKYIKDYEDIAKEYGADFVVYRCNGQFQNTHNVPRSVLASMKAGFEDWDGEIDI